MKFNCQRCNKRQLRVGVNLFLDIPCNLYGRLSKDNLRKKSVKIKGAGWENNPWPCPNEIEAERWIPWTSLKYIFEWEKK